MDAYDRLIARAGELVAETVAPFRGVFPHELVEAIAVQLTAELVLDPEARAELRRTLSDAVVDQSGERGEERHDDSAEEVKTAKEEKGSA